MNTTAFYEQDQSQSEGLYKYDGYPFERVIYLYLWAVFVVLTCLLNIVVISVLLRKRMRNPTFMILAAISVSDTLTGLVALPTYIPVFLHYSEATVADTVDDLGDIALNDTSLDPAALDYFQSILRAVESNPSPSLNTPPHGYFISEELCDWFMFSKFFLSKTFHTASVWLTLYLAFLRFLIVYFPFRKVSRMTVKKVVIICVIVFLFSPFLHIYHLFKDKSIRLGDNLDCTWEIEVGGDCGLHCVYFWVSILLGQLLPAAALSVFTVYFIYNIQKSSEIANQRSDQGRQTGGNKRLTILVAAILFVFLVPELPYTVFLLYTVICSHAEIHLDLRFERTIHATYEVLLMLSFNANFFLYTFINKQFRQVLEETIVFPIYNRTCLKLCGVCQEARRLSITRQQSADTHETNL